MMVPVLPVYGRSKEFGARMGVRGREATRSSSESKPDYLLEPSLTSTLRQIALACGPTAPMCIFTVSHGSHSNTSAGHFCLALFAIRGLEGRDCTD